MESYLYETAVKTVGSVVPDCDVAIFGGILNQGSLPTYQAGDKFHGDINQIWMWYNVPISDSDFLEQFEPL